VPTTVAKRSPPITKRPALWPRVWLPALAAVLAAAVYINALDNPFVYDDHDTIIANPSLVDPANIRFVFVYSPFRPLVNVSYAVDRMLWDMQPFGFHLTNVILHALVVVLMYAFVRVALADVRSRTTGTDPGTADRWWAFTAASLFAVHPLMSEAVGYVSGRSEVLCAVFFLSALLMARAALMRGGATWAAAALFWVLALLSKEVAIVFPAVVFAYDYLLLPDSATRRRQRLWRLYFPCTVLLVAGAAYRLSRASGPMSTESPLLNLWTQSIVIWRYVALAIAPVGQSIMHSVHRVTSLGDVKALLAVLAIVLVVVAAVLARRIRPLVAFGLFWFLAVIAPSSSVIALREGMAEHRVYLAGAGLSIAAVGVVSAIFLRARAHPRTGYGVVLAIVLGILGVLTVRRNDVWGKPAELWGEATVHAAGMWEPHYALADVLRESGDCESAIREYEIVLKIRPQHRDANTNLGICLAQAQRFEEAEAALRRALEIDPAFARGYTNLGALALTMRDEEGARDAYRRAIEVDPGNVLARMQLARLYEAVFRDFHSAARMCGEARALAPATPGVAECVERNQRLAAAKDAGK
jgi:protein O-mannosyl-transferase